MTLAARGASRNAQTPLGMLADDLTGACDTGAQFAARGFRTLVLLSPKSAAAEAADLYVLTTDSRADGPDMAGEKVAQGCSALAGIGAPVFYKKIDSTLRGNVGAEIGAVLQVCDFPFAVIAPAFPAMGRALTGGCLWIQGQGTPAGPNLPERLRAQGLGGVLHVGCRRLRSGEDALRRQFRRAWEQGDRFIVVDAISENDLHSIARTALAFTPSPLLVGSGGLAAPVAEILAHARTRRYRGTDSDPTSDSPKVAGKSSLAIPRPQPVVLFIGSKNPITETQVERLRADGQAQSVRLDERAVETACETLAVGKPLVVPIRWEGHEEERALHTLLPLLEGFSARGLVLSGGDTAALVCRLLGAQALRLVGEIRTGMPWGRLIGGQAHGMAVCTKAGGFGDENALLDAVDFLHNDTGNA